MDMIGVNLKTAFRHLGKHRLSAFINVVGLAIGIASCLLITFYVNDELSYDQFYEDSEQVFRLNTYWKQEESDEKFATSPPPLGPMLLEMSPDVVAMTRIIKRSDFTMRPDHDFSRPYRETNAWTVDSGFLKVLNSGVIAGDPETMLTVPNAVVLPKTTAIRYFGQEAFDAGNIVGRKLGGGGDGGTPWLVTGIIPDQPEQSHFQFDMLLSAAGETGFDLPNWGWISFYTYVKLKDDSPETVQRVNDRLEYILANHAIKNFGISIEKLRGLGLDMRYSVQPLEDIHLKSSLVREMRPNGNLNYVQSMTIVAIFIIVLACVNFINLSTAKSAIRAKEVGVKKALGCHRKQLIAQYLTESLVMAFMAMLLALGLVEIVVNLLKSISDWHISSAMIKEPATLFILLLATTAIGLTSGIYPALYMTAFKPIRVLKGNWTGSRRDKPLRNFLVGFQFCISIGLIITTLIINGQIDYIQSKDLGFDRENVMVIQNDREIDERRGEFKARLKESSLVMDASFTTGLPGLPQYGRRDFTVEGRRASMGIDWFQIDDNFLSTLDIKLLEGRNFSTMSSTDSSGLLLNQTAVRELGLEDPVGTYITINKGQNDARKVQVIGVIEDFNLTSFDRKIGTLALEFLGNYGFKDYIAIRLGKGDLNRAIKEVKATWQDFEPNVPMVYSFLDQDFDRLFQSEQRLARIFNSFTALAIFIACLGLFGLASYTAEQRIREISIRKVLGARAISLLVLLYKSYFRLILCSFIVAGLLAYSFAKEWLSGFVYRIDIGFQPFLVALLGAVVIAGLTVMYQSLKAILSNPAETLKTE